MKSTQSQYQYQAQIPSQIQLLPKCLALLTKRLAIGLKPKTLSFNLQELKLQEIVSTMRSLALLTVLQMTALVR